MPYSTRPQWKECFRMWDLLDSHWPQVDPHKRTCREVIDELPARLFLRLGRAFSDGWVEGSARNATVPLRGPGTNPGCAGGRFDVLFTVLFVMYCLPSRPRQRRAHGAQSVCRVTRYQLKGGRKNVKGTSPFELVPC